MLISPPPLGERPLLRQAHTVPSGGGAARRGLRHALVPRPRPLWGALVVVQDQSRLICCCSSCTAVEDKLRLLERDPEVSRGMYESASSRRFQRCGRHARAAVGCRDARGGGRHEKCYEHCANEKRARLSIPRYMKLGPNIALSLPCIGGKMSFTSCMNLRHVVSHIGHCHRCNQSSFS